MDGNKWDIVEQKLHKKFKFDNFSDALAFVSKVGDLAEKEDHHPDITFGWGYAEVVLFTHSENTITEKDQSLAERIDELI